MKTKLTLKVVGLIGVLALISAGYCFWLMNRSTFLRLGARCSDWVCRVDRRVCHLVDQFSYRPRTIASCIACSADQADHLISRLQPPLTYAEGIPQSE